jgi:two-component system NtrC family sensor kinase
VSQRGKQEYGLILLSILVIIIALLLYRNNKFQKRANQMLLNQKEELARKNDKLDALIATREKFFSIISHDLRGPVNAFHGLSTIINSSIKEKQYSALPEVATHIEKAALHLSMLLDNLLSWAMNQKGSLPGKPGKSQYQNHI